MIPIKPALSYFRDCYRLDTRTTQLDNFFGRKAELRHVFEGKERLLNHDMPYLPIPDGLGKKMEAGLNLYSREKALYYCSFFVLGYASGLQGRRRRVCAPLILHEADLLEQEDGYAISVNFNRRTINSDPMSHLRNAEEDVRTLISKSISSEAFDFGKLGKLKRVLSQVYEGFDTEDLWLYPSLTPEKTIKRLYNTKAIQEGAFKVVPASGVCIVRRSGDTQGIITELGQMAAEETGLPDSIRVLFGEKAQSKLPKDKLGFIPAILNEAQQKVIQNAHNQHLSMVIGPPGTGKSFTIASLAIEFMSRGKSVLIVSKTDQAVNVIDDKIERDLDIHGATVRAGKSDYLKDLKSRMTGILSGFRTREARKFLNEEGLRADDLKWRIKACDKLLEDSRKAYEDLLRHEERWGYELSENAGGNFFSRLLKRYILWVTGRKEPHWLIVADFMHAITTRTDLVRQYIETVFALRIKSSLLRDRRTLRKLLNAIRARTSSKRELLFSQLNFGTMFHAFPIWLCKLADLHKVLPFQRHLFDLVIIDEATQCDIASCLPAIYRGTRSVIIGDPKQLRHVSFLSMAAQENLRRKHGLINVGDELDYRHQSILDFADNALESQSQLSFLNEHYRSLPDLIHFSNKHFYEDGLRLMNVLPEDHSASNIDHISVAGIRNKKGINEIEAESIIEQLRKMIDEEALLDEVLCRSIGVLSPFRDQVDFINQRLMHSFSVDELRKHQLHCGTAHSFQGEERDVMLLSFCLDDQSHSTGFNHINRPDVFNVTITRAKSSILVYTSFDLKKLRHDNYLRAYLEESGTQKRTQRQKHEVHDEFLNEVRKILIAKGHQVRVGHEVADHSLDLVVIKKKEKIAIDLIGYPGVYVEGLSLSAYKVLHRTGIRTFPLPYTFWKLDQEHCVEALLNFLDQSSEPEEPVADGDATST